MSLWNAESVNPDTVTEADIAEVLGYQREEI